jgi:RimJ/RimL family protein N-acetyltransferase
MHALLGSYDVGGPKARVTLRPLELQDGDVIAGWAADAEFCREADWTADLAFAEYQRFHRNLIESAPPSLIRLGAIHAGVLVGYVDLHGEESDRRELGFLIGERSRWGQGLGRLAGYAGLAFGFEQLGLQEIWAEAPDANRRSVRILERLGLVETGRGDEGVFRDQPTYYRRFAITAKDWFGQPH